MTDISKEKTFKLIELIPKWAPIILMVIMVALSSHFVTKDEFKTIEENLNKVQTNQLIIMEQNKINQRQEKRFQDHEQRIRELEGHHHWSDGGH